MLRRTTLILALTVGFLQVGCTQGHRSGFPELATGATQDAAIVGSVTVGYFRNWHFSDDLAVANRGLLMRLRADSVQT
jgi:hypothetical protein